MARPNEIGLNYFPMDVNIFSNEKIQLVKSEFGNESIVVYLKLLCSIFEKNGYYYNWNDDKKLLLANALNIKGSLVGEIVAGLIRRSLFDKRVFDSFSVLTSKQIQLNYLEASKRRENVEIIQQFTLTDISVYKNSHYCDIKDTLTTDNDNINTQSKVKESKGKESKEIPSPKKLEISQEASEFSNYFKSLLTSNQKITDTDLYNWGKTYDELVRIDKRTKDEIYKVVDWARKDSFWKDNFLSANKLRHKNRDGVLYFDVFFQKSKLNGSFNNGTTGSKLRTPDWLK